MADIQTGLIIILILADPLDMEDTKLHDTSLEDGESLCLLDKSGEGTQLDSTSAGIMEVKRKAKRVRIGMGKNKWELLQNACFVIFFPLTFKEIQKYFLFLIDLRGTCYNLPFIL
jgi:hypothetical protein